MSKSKGISETSEPINPARIVIGVTGHRKLDDEPALAEQVHLILKRIRQLIPPSKKTLRSFSILSPLAEGADRLVAREVLKTPDSQLEVVLPLEKDDYKQDFELPESKAEFERCLAQARSIKQLPSTSSRTEAYAQVGRYVVDNCDFLIALWDGKPAAGQGGTAEIVEYAREKGCPFFWINTREKVSFTYEPGKGLLPSERLDKRSIEKRTKVS
jgi:hypothetical protein